VSPPPTPGSDGAFLTVDRTKIVSLPDLQIIDFAYGHTGSTHDATAWEQTQLAKEHDALLAGGEWVWADSAYPVSEPILTHRKPTYLLPLTRFRHGSWHHIGHQSEHAQRMPSLTSTYRDFESNRNMPSASSRAGFPLSKGFVFRSIMQICTASQHIGSLFALRYTHFASGSKGRSMETTTKVTSIHLSMRV